LLTHSGALAAPRSKQANRWRISRERTKRGLAHVAEAIQYRVLDQEETPYARHGVRCLPDCAHYLQWRTWELSIATSTTQLTCNGSCKPLRMYLQPLDLDYTEMHRRTVVLLVVCCFVTRPVAAQGPARVGISQYDSRSISLTSPVIGVVLPTRGADSMPVRRYRLSDSIPRSHWAKGAKIGGAIGFGVGFLGFGAASANGDGSSTGRNVAAGFVGGIVFGACTAIIGGLIGSEFHD
jgi:hypothetical protein